MEMECVLRGCSTNGDGVRVGWVLISHGDGVCVVWVLTAARLRQHGDMSACWLGAHQQWKRGCVFCWVVASNGDMGVCLFGAEQQRTHE